MPVSAERRDTLLRVDGCGPFCIVSKSNNDIEQSHSEAYLVLQSLISDLGFLQHVRG